MKKCFILSFIFFFLMNFLHAQKIDIEKAYKIVLKNDNRISEKDVFYLPNLLAPNQEITNLQTLKSPDFQSWFFFVDNFPYQSWSHSCYYMFVNSETGEFKKIKASFPPKLEGMKVKILQPMPEKGKLFDFKKQADKMKSATVYDASNDYAVIISGGIDDEQNWFRYWNDCSAIYSALVDVYNFSRSNIYVIMADGTSSGLDRVLSRTPNGLGGYNYTRDSSPLDLDGDGTNDIQYSAKKSNIKTVFNTLSGILDEEDHLFVFTTDHGGQTSGNDVYLCLWGENMNDDEFATELNKVDAGKISIVMGQCHSGGFIDDLSADNRTISTACTANEYSWAMSNGTYEEYLFHWISAVVGETPDGTTVDADDNNDGWVSMHEAFEFAENADTRSETPQYNSMPADLGCFVRLSDNWNWRLSGPSVVCTDGTYTVNDVPDGATVTWEGCSSTLNPPSGSTANPGTFDKVSDGSGWIDVSINNACGTIDLPRKSIWVGKPTNNNIDFGVYFSNPPNNIVPRYTPIAIGIADNPNETLQRVSKYNWQFGSWSSYVTGYDNPGSSPTNSIANVYLDDYAPSSQIVIVSAENQCGSYWPEFGQGKMFYTDDYGYYMSFSPNPTTNETTLLIKSNSEEKAIDDNTEWDLEVYNSIQSLKLKKTKIKGTNSTKINTQSWKEGVYTVRAKYKDKVLIGKLVVKK